MICPSKQSDSINAVLIESLASERFPYLCCAVIFVTQENVQCEMKQPSNPVIFKNYIINKIKYYCMLTENTLDTIRPHERFKRLRFNIKATQRDNVLLYWTGYWRSITGKSLLSLLLSRLWSEQNTEKGP